jgi:hypothetical protein
MVDKLPTSTNKIWTPLYGLVKTNLDVNENMVIVDTSGENLTIGSIMSALRLGEGIRLNNKLLHIKSIKLSN